MSLNDMPTMTRHSGDTTAQSYQVRVPPYGLAGILTVPAQAKCLVVFVHGSGSSHKSPRNQAVARALNDRGMATFLFDLLTPEEDQHYRNRFNIPRLAERLNATLKWLDGHDILRSLPLGLFGSSTGAAAAIIGAQYAERKIGAIVSRGGRPDLAGAALDRTQTPCLFLVGGRDLDVLELNEQAFAHLRGPKDIQVIAGATHLFEEPGTLEAVIDKAGDWFEKYLVQAAPERNTAVSPRPSPARYYGHGPAFKNRRDAGEKLAELLADQAYPDPVIMALPRGGVPIGAKIAERLHAPLDIIIVRKIGVPQHPELAMGAIVNSDPPITIRNEEIIRYAHVSEADFNAVRNQELAEMARRRQLYLGDRERLPLKGRTIIVVDDGIATGATAVVALRAMRQVQPRKLVLAVPVGATETLHRLKREADEVICFLPQDDLGAVGIYYEDFDQTTDQEVSNLLAAHKEKL